MTPIEARFNDGMELASRMKGNGQAAYWGGYTAGLMRGLFGSRAVTDSQHRALADLGTAGDKARGYRDGHAEVLAILSVDVPGSDDPLTGSSLTPWVVAQGAACRGHPLHGPLAVWENEGGAVAQPRIVRIAVARRPR